jgi:ribosome biogenesis GTPase
VGQLEDLGWDDRWATHAAGRTAPGLAPGRVLRHDGAAVLVALCDRTVHVHLRATSPPLAVGDWVLVDRDDAVADVLPRRGLLQRRDPSTGFEQLMAANVDLLGIVCGLDRRVNRGRIERFVTLARDAGAIPLVVLSKGDLLGDTHDAEEAASVAAPGCDVIVVSARERAGIADLRARLTGLTVAFVGESGSGKSALVNALAGQDLAATAEVRTGDHKGRHTTTARQLHLLPGPACLIDTPGLREVGLWTDTSTVDLVFDDIAELAATCRFGNCGHTTEPGCALREAVEDGTLGADRLAGWERLRREAASAELRADPHARRQSERRFARVVRQAKDTHRR